MSRIMRSTGVVAGGSATLVDLLTVPADHKYEVLYAAMHKTPASGDLNGFLFDPSGGGGPMWIHMEQGSPEWSCELITTAFCLEVGDKLQCYASSSGLNAVVTYVDVTPV